MTNPDTTSATSQGHRNRAQTSRCHRCGAPVIRGLDDAIAALTAIADPRRLSRSDELTALLSDRTTYRYTQSPRPQLRRRDHWQIAGTPADLVTVVAEHRCGVPLGVPLPAASTATTPTEVPY